MGDAAAKAANDIEAQRAEAETQWKQRLERAAFETDRAHRQYHAVEPENRLVARTLETAWEEKLREQRSLTEQYERFVREPSMLLTAEQRDRIRRLASDVPGLWNAPGTTDADRKEILREVIDRIVVNVEGETEWVEAKVYWAGGHQTYIRFRRPVARVDQLSTWPLLKERLRTLLDEGMRASKIATQLTGEGFRAPNGHPIGAATVRTLMMRYEFSAIRRSNVIVQCERSENQWLIPKLVAKLRVGYQTVYGWIKKCRVDARQLTDGRWVITADDDKCRELALFQTRQRHRRLHHEDTSQTAKL